MNRGRQNGKRHTKKKVQGGFAATKRDRLAVSPLPEQPTGAVRVMNDNTVPGGYRLEPVVPT
jgi:hypothetical protein